MKRVFVSSTYRDLASYRQKASTVIRHFGHLDIAMEHFSAEDERPVEKCRQEVRGSDVYVCIIASNYGFVPPNSNISITEIEYETALAAGKYCIVLLLREKSLCPELNDAPSTPISRFRSRLAQHHVVDWFSNEHELAEKLAGALVLWERRARIAAESEVAQSVVIEGFTADGFVALSVFNASDRPAIINRIVRSRLYACEVEVPRPVTATKSQPRVQRIELHFDLVHTNYAAEIRGDSHFEDETDLLRPHEVIPLPPSSTTSFIVRPTIVDNSFSTPGDGVAEFSRIVFRVACFDGRTIELSPLAVFEFACTHDAGAAEDVAVQTTIHQPELSSMIRRLIEIGNKGFSSYHNDYSTTWHRFVSSVEPSNWVALEQLVQGYPLSEVFLQHLAEFRPLPLELQSLVVEQLIARLTPPRENEPLARWSRLAMALQNLSRQLDFARAADNEEGCNASLHRVDEILRTLDDRLPMLVAIRLGRIMCGLRVDVEVVRGITRRITFRRREPHEAAQGPGAWPDDALTRASFLALCCSVIRSKPSWDDNMVGFLARLAQIEAMRTVVDLNYRDAIGAVRELIKTLDAHVLRLRTEPDFVALNAAALWLVSTMRIASGLRSPNEWSLVRRPVELIAAAPVALILSWALSNVWWGIMAFVGTSVLLNLMKRGVLRVMWRSANRRALRLTNLPDRSS